MDVVILSSSSHFILLSTRTNKRTGSLMGEFHVGNNNYEVVHCSKVKGGWSLVRGEPQEFYLPEEGNSYQVWRAKSKE